MEIDGKEVMSREEFFKKEGMPRFEISPLDMMLAKAQHQLLGRTRQELTKDGKDSVEESFEMKSPLLQVSRITIRCFKVMGQPQLLDLVMCVEDKEQEHIAKVWLELGDIDEIEPLLDSNRFVPLCKLWVKWLDYALKNYPQKGGLLCYHTDWERKAPQDFSYCDVDLYSISSSQTQELRHNLELYGGPMGSSNRLFEKECSINVNYPGAPGNEMKFECMSMYLRFYERGQIDLVGIIWFQKGLSDSVATRIIVHSFNRVDKCLHWLSRGEHTTHDCCFRMGELLYHGKSS